MIDENKSRIPAWFIWSTNQAGTVTLEAVALTQWRADSYRKTLLGSSRNYVRVRIEKSEVNHLFGVDLDEMWWDLYGTEAQRRAIQGQIKMANRQLTAVLKAGQMLWTRVGLLMKGLSRDTVGYDGVREAMNETIPWFRPRPNTDDEQSK